MACLLEMGTSEEIYNFGVHPYTLKACCQLFRYPDPDHERQRRRIKYQARTSMMDKNRCIERNRTRTFCLCNRSKKSPIMRKNCNVKKKQY
jgi:ABC-type oligopeptide transport system ATPase subunit